MHNKVLFIAFDLLVLVNSIEHYCSTNQEKPVNKNFFFLFPDVLKVIKCKQNENQLKVQINSTNKLSY